MCEKIVQRKNNNRMWTVKKMWKYIDDLFAMHWESAKRTKYVRGENYNENI